jgi:hypothetical protein
MSTSQCVALTEQEKRDMGALARIMFDIYKRQQPQKRKKAPPNAVDRLPTVPR